MAEASTSDAPQGGVVMRMERIYLKDASFESPGTPALFLEQWQPQFHVDIRSKQQNLGEHKHEVVLAVTVTAKKDEDQVGFIAEVQQAGIFHVEGVADAQLQQILAVAAPNILFPYVREMVDSLVVRGGFPAVQLAPVNFEQLYVQAMQQRDENATEH